MSVKKNIFDAVATRLATIKFTFNSVQHTPEVIKGIGNPVSTIYDLMYGEGDSRRIDENYWETDLIIDALFDAGITSDQVDALLSLEETILSGMLQDPFKDLGGYCSHIYCSNIDMLLDASDQMTVKGKRFIFKLTYMNPI